MLLRISALPAIAALSCLCVSCAHRPDSALPRVSIAPNHSGIKAAKIRPHGPEDGFMQKLPAGAEISLAPSRPPSNAEPRYFVSANGTLDILDISRPDDYRTLVRDWKAILAPNAPAPSEIDLSEIPWINAGRMFTAKIRKRSFPWGNAVLFLASYAQGCHGGPVNNEELILVVQGITRDGRYSVHGHLPISHPKLPDTAETPAGKKNKIHFPFDQPAGAKKWLDTQPDNAFRPAIGQYEEFLSALVIRNPGT